MYPKLYIITDQKKGKLMSLKCMYVGKPHIAGGWFYSSRLYVYIYMCVNGCFCFDIVHIPNPAQGVFVIDKQNLANCFLDKYFQTSIITKFFLKACM